jgi:Uma2 family endonuclease
MPFMSLATSQDVFAAAEHIPMGSALVVHDFGWQDYEQLLEFIGDRPGFRISYDCGRLEIVSPSPKHDNYSRSPDLFVAAFCELRGHNLQIYGSATWKSEGLHKAVEADACYYVKNAERVVGAKDIRLGTHPPPDIAVEIDITNSSLNKLSIYAALSIPEVWRYDGRTFTFYSLKSDKYQEARESLQLPGLTGAMLLEALQDTEARGPIAALKAFRRRIRLTKR